MTTKMPFAAMFAAGVLMSASALAQQGPIGSSPQGSSRNGMAVQPRDSRIGQPSMSESDRSRSEDMQQQRTRTNRSQAQRQTTDQEQTNRAQTQQASRYNREQVRQVQQSLNDRGFQAGPVDGIWGPKTSGAVQQFQQAQGIRPTGQLNTQTAEALGIGAGSQTSENPAVRSSPRRSAPSAQPGATSGQGRQSPSAGSPRGSSLPGVTDPSDPSRDMPGTPTRPSP